MDNLDLDSKILSLSKNVVVFRDNYNGHDAVRKSYKPENYRDSLLRNEKKKEENDISNQPQVVMEGGYKKSAKFYFEKEVKMLFQLTDYARRNSLEPIVPRYFNCDIGKSEIIMEYLPWETFCDKFLEFGDNDDTKNYYRDKLLQYVTDFQNLVNSPEVSKNLLNNFYSSNRGKRRKLIDFRPLDELTSRYSHYLRLINFHYSSEFRKKYSIDEWEYSHPAWKNMKKNINHFLHRKGFFLKNFVDRVLNRDMQILYGDKDPYRNKSDLAKLINEGSVAIIHGDFGPQNVFYRPRTTGKVIDFNESRLGSRHVDLVHCLYHVSNNPTEMKALTLLSNYLNNTLQNLNQIDWEESFAQFIETRLLENIRIIASDCRRDRKELSQFAGLVKDKRSTTIELRRYNLNRHLEFLDFYLRGEGRGSLLGSHPALTLVRDQLHDVDNFFHAIMLPPTGFVKRSQRIQSNIGKNKNK